MFGRQKGSLSDTIMSCYRPLGLRLTLISSTIFTYYSLSGKEENRTFTLRYAGTFPNVSHSIFSRQGIMPRYLCMSLSGKVFMTRNNATIVMHAFCEVNMIQKKKNIR